MESVSNGGVLKGRLQVLHIHVLLVAPLGASHMLQTGTDQHEGRVAVWDAAYYTGVAAITRFSRSMTLLVRMQVQCLLGKSQ